tara:strand:+ start:896 stop:1081 length:186 start_codon:yes stop_codon:yes gene_type:complete
MEVYKKSYKEMIRLVLKKLLKKYGSVGLLVYVGDFIVAQTKSKKDDKLWKKIKKVIQKFNG